MWLPTSIIEDVKKVARVHYVGMSDCETWNKHRREGELRLLTGWAWTARNGREFRQGFKTITVAYRDAWYELVDKSEAPSISRARLRVVARRAA